jgi:hypothetical protein
VSVPINADFGFVILSPEHNVGQVKSTLTSLRPRFPKSPIVCVTPNEAHPGDVKEISDVCPCFRGGDTITSLINTGLKKGHQGWNVIMFAGSFVDNGTLRKMFSFVKSDKDVLFPIVVDYDKLGRTVRLHADFVEGTLNGLIVHSKTFAEVGDFTDTPIEVSKTFWGLDAAKFGCIFKGILGAKII